MKILSPLNFTPFRPQLPTESTETYIALRKEHFTEERLLKVPGHKITMSNNLVDVFGSGFEYLLDKVLDITEIKPKLAPLEAIANQEEYYLPF